MKYFIGYVIEGEAEEYYKNICKELARNFGIKDLSLRLPPHLTFVPPFEIEDNKNQVRERIIQALKMIADEQKIINFNMKGFGRFGHGSRTIFLSFEASEEVNNVIQEINQKIKDLVKQKIISVFELKLLSKNIHLHTSIARFLTPNLSNKIWNYLKELHEPRFKLKFDNLTLFELKESGWISIEVFRFI
jgi:2'-5' RNA ligase